MFEVMEGVKVRATNAAAQGLYQRLTRTRCQFGDLIAHQSGAPSYHCSHESLHRSLGWLRDHNLNNKGTAKIFRRLSAFAPPLRIGYNLVHRNFRLVRIQWTFSSANDVSLNWRNGSMLRQQAAVASRFWAAKQASVKPRCYKSSRGGSARRVCFGEHAMRCLHLDRLLRCTISRARRRAHCWRSSTPARTAKRFSPGRSMSSRACPRW